MDAINVLKRLHQHRAWVNGNLLNAAAQLRDDQLRAPFPIGQGSIWKSLVHMYAAEYVWLEALSGNEEPLVQGDLPGKIPGNQQGNGPITGLDELRQKWSALEQRWLGHLAAIQPAALDEIVYKKSSFSGAVKRFGTRRSDILMHICTHAHYTTAQVVNMLRQTGVEKLPDVMLIALARHEGA